MLNVEAPIKLRILILECIEAMGATSYYFIHIGLHDLDVTHS